MCDLPHISEETQPIDSLPDESLFLISTFNPWYGDLILYLQTQRFKQHINHDEHRCIHHHSKYYLIINDTLYRHDIDSILRHYLTHDKVEIVMSDCHSRSCGSHISGMDTSQKYYALGTFGLRYSKIVWKS